jgi:hypothetical protein
LWFFGSSQKNIYGQTEDKPQGVAVDKLVFGECFTSAKPELVIRDESTFQLEVKKRASPDCASVAYPQIDFSEYSLIGVSQSIPRGCSSGIAPFIIQVIRDDRQKVYRHLTINARGLCAGAPRHQSWVLVPKLPTGYKVEFDRVNDPSLVIYIPSPDYW